MIFVFDEEKIPKPTPIKTRIAPRKTELVVSVIKHSPASPTAIMDIPNVARKVADILPDNLPEISETTACTTDLPFAESVPSVLHVFKL